MTSIFKALADPTRRQVLEEALMAFAQVFGLQVTSETPTPPARRRAKEKS